MTLSLAEWAKYRDLLSKLSQTAADEFRDAIWGANGRFGGVGLGNIPREDVIEYAYALVTKYGEGSSELACQMYDAMAEVSGMHLAPAVPAETASLNDVGRAINGTIKVSQLPEYVSATVGRLVKQASQDTTLQNALRDGAQFAWVPSGDTCPFCIMLASRGWQRASKKAIKGGHAEHIHSNCNCVYAISFDGKTKIEGYDPDKYLAMYENAKGDTWQEKLTSMRYEQMQSPEARARRNAQRRAAYELKTKQKGDIIRGAASIGDGRLVRYDENANFTVAIPQYSDEINQILSDAARRVAKVGSKELYEYASLIDLDTGVEVLFDTSEEFDCVNAYYSHLRKNLNGRFAMVHNHNAENPLSLPDIQELAMWENLEVITAVTNNGLMTSAVSNGRMLKDLFETEFADVGKDAPTSREKELMQVEAAVKKYVKGGIVVNDGRR